MNVEKEYKILSLCGLFGMSRQAYYQYKEPDFKRLSMEGLIIEYVKEIRQVAPRLGGKKLWHMCKEFFGDLFDLGRDSFLRLLHERGLMLRIRKRRCRTTYSQKTSYKNLTLGLAVDRPGVVWVADITYIWTRAGFCFLSLITDSYSHKIVGWRLAPTLESVYTLDALQMAIEDSVASLTGLIHHSDRGVQYNSYKYIEVLSKEGILISQTENSDPLENAIAERINGILKQEWLSLYEFESIEHVRPILEGGIEFYNTKRPHQSIDYLTPEAAEKRTGLLKNHWKRKNKRQRKEVNMDI